ncbi:unnamed protein product [Prorocentrum cordatum]|uniref:Uncharacterized protein n=1 Tax=Prorocentrum cordatum TaxID=2364126 RepID=A0ABN9W9B8_9DINO|nr:unnamed protein product [Polarella glacialis]
MALGSTQVFPVISNERVFNIVVLLGRAMVFSVVVSAMLSNAAQTRFDLKNRELAMEELTRFLHAFKIQPWLRMQARQQMSVKLMPKRPQAVKDLCVCACASACVFDMISLILRHQTGALQPPFPRPRSQPHPLDP